MASKRPLKLSSKEKIGKSPTITQFFSKTVNCSQKVPENCSQNAFYQHSLPSVSPKIDICNESSPIVNFPEDLKKIKAENERLSTENSALKEQLKKVRDDFNKLLKLHNETCRMYVNKEMKIKLLEKKRVTSSDIVLFDRYKNDFDAIVLKELLIKETQQN